MQHGIALGLLFIGITSLVFSFVMYGCVVALLLRKAKGPTPGVSILKPLKGADDELYANLASLAGQQYPEFEIVFGAEDSMDPALAVARRIKREFPGVRVTIVAGGRPIGNNPKVNNLVQLARVAKYDWILVSDADVRVDPHYLHAITSETRDPRVGLVSSLIANVEERSLGATLDSLHMNGFVAAAVAAAHLVAGHPCVVGKSMLLRRSDLARLGGFDAVKDVLAEDYVLGQMYRRAGFAVALSGHPVHAVCPDRTVASFFDRHVRWGQMRRQCAPYLYVGEPLLVPTLWFVAAAAVAFAPGHAGRPEAQILCVSLFGLVARCVSQALQSRTLTGRTPHLSDVPLVVVKDAVLLAAWALGSVRSTVSWRGTALRIGRGSVLTPIAHSERSPARRAA